jgi:P27 family predicted phage terminase small subunit
MTDSRKPPKNLSREARNLWRKIQDEYQISDEAGLLILAIACEAFDRMRQAQDILSNEGMTTTDRFGQARAHPAATIERDSRAAMLGALKQMNFDLEPLRDGPGRPGNFGRR